MRATAEVLELDDQLFDVDSIEEAWWRGTQPPPSISVADHAAQHRVLSGKHAARPGPYRHEVAPHAVFVMNALSASSPFQRVVAQKAAQVVFTTIAENWIQYIVDVDPGPIIVVFPTLDLAKDFSESRLDPMIDESELLRGLIAPARSRDSKNRRLSKAFPGGDIKMRGANSPSGLRSISGRYLVVDELDEFMRNLKGQGRALLLARRALRTFPNRKEFILSTPTLEGSSQIVAEFESCEQGWEYQVFCPFCETQQALPTPISGWERVQYPAWHGHIEKGKKGGVLDARDASGDPVEIEGVEIECVSCGGRMAEHHKATMLRVDGWKCLWNNGDRSLGVRMSAMAATTALFSWGRAIAAYELGKRNPEDMRVVYNHVFGIPYAETHETPPWKTIYERREDYRVGVVPERAIFLTAQTDVQRNPARLEVEVKAWGRNCENWSIFYDAFPAKDLDDDEHDPSWLSLTELLYRRFPCGGGRTLPIRALGIDMNFFPEPVYRWARRHPQPAVSAAGVAVRAPHTVIVTRGVDTWDRAIYAPKPADAGKKKRGVYIFSMGVSGLKAEFYRWLRQERPTDEELAVGKAFPFGTCHHPRAYGVAYFQGAVAEKLVIKTKAGAPDPTWVSTGVPNEPLDLHVGNRAMATLLGIDRFTEAQWRRLERERYGEEGPPTPPAPTSPPTGPDGPAPSTLPEVPLPPGARPSRGRFSPASRNWGIRGGG